MREHRTHISKWSSWQCLKTSFTTSKVDEAKKDLKFQIDNINSKLPEISVKNSNWVKNTEIKNLMS